MAGFGTATPAGNAGSVQSLRDGPKDAMLSVCHLRDAPPFEGACRDTPRLHFEERLGGGASRPHLRGRFMDQEWLAESNHHARGKREPYGHQARRSLPILSAISRAGDWESPEY